MSTLTITRAHLSDLLPGDRIVALDGVAVGTPHVVAAAPSRPGWAVELVNPRPETGVAWRLYPDSQITESITVERAEPAPAPRPEPVPPVRPARPKPQGLAEPTFDPNDSGAVARASVWHDQGHARRALKRNETYRVALLLIGTGKGAPVDVRNAPGELLDAPEWRGGRYWTARSLAHTCGTMAAFYGWVVKVAPYTFRLTTLGAVALRMLDD